MVLAPYVLPGERVLVRPRQEARGVVRAVPVKIGQTSGERIEARCPHFGRCGGCHYQHAGHDYQLAQKRAILAETLGRVGKIQPPEIETADGPPWEYRNRIQLHIAGGRIGFHRAGSHRLCAVERCPISSPKLNEAIAALRRMIKQPRWPGMIRSLELFTNEQQVQLNVRETDGRRLARTFFDWCAGQISGADASQVDYQAADEVYRVSPGSFFQVNRFLVDRLVELVVGSGEGAHALDLHAGVGLFSLPLARRFQHVAAVEPRRSAYKDLDHNADRAGLRIEAHHGTAEAYLESLSTAPDLIVADPPRAGLGKRLVSELLRLKPERLTVVSCDPATLARDLDALLAGGYSIEGMTLIDLFPQTYHIETVTKLRRSS